MYTSVYTQCLLDLSHLISDSITPTLSVLSKQKKKMGGSQNLFFASASFSLWIHLHVFTCDVRVSMSAVHLIWNFNLVSKLNRKIFHTKICTQCIIMHSREYPNKKYIYHFFGLFWGFFFSFWSKCPQLWNMT